MKPRKAKDLRELTESELLQMLRDTTETLARLRIQHSLSQLQDTASLKVLKKDLARIKTILSEKQRARKNG
ncbi:MAG: 50S ribosomal protein L29 [Ignavibacteria bacterium]|nr:50S ribosomal protein L29 [Ignavibacteria bacterium]